MNNSSIIGSSITATYGTDLFPIKEANYILTDSSLFLMIITAGVVFPYSIQYCVLKVLSRGFFILTCLNSISNSWQLHLRVFFSSAWVALEMCRLDTSQISL